MSSCDIKIIAVDVLETRNMQKSVTVFHKYLSCCLYCLRQLQYTVTIYRVIRNVCRGFNNLPSPSPDAIPCDFFLWGYVKDQVYVPPFLVSIPELNVRIGTAIETITADMLQTVWNELDYRVDVCRITKCAYIEHL